MNSQASSPARLDSGGGDAVPDTDTVRVPRGATLATPGRLINRAVRPYSKLCRGPLVRDYPDAPKTEKVTLSWLIDGEATVPWLSITETVPD